MQHKRPSSRSSWSLEPASCLSIFVTILRPFFLIRMHYFLVVFRSVSLRSTEPPYELERWRPRDQLNASAEIATLDSANVQATIDVSTPVMIERLGLPCRLTCVSRLFLLPHGAKWECVKGGSLRGALLCEPRHFLMAF